VRKQPARLIFRFFVAIGIALAGVASPVKGQVYVGGELTGDETYSPVNNPYIVTQDLIVRDDITLTILPGVEMLFESGTGLINNGTLIARGTPGERIRFLPRNQLEFPGQWSGLVFNHSKTILNDDSTYKVGSILSETVIRFASYSVTLNNNTRLLIEKSDIDICSFGIYLNESGYNTIRDCNFLRCNFGIFMANGYSNPENNIYGNLIFQSSEVGIFINSSSSGSDHNSITGNTIKACNIGLHIGNYGNNGPGKNRVEQNIFIGNKDAVKLFQQVNNVSYNYFLSNRNGILCWQSDNNTITRNLFSKNVLNGIVLAAGSSFNSITYNSFNYNDGGVWVKPDSSRNSLNNTFLYNTLSKNRSFSFQVQSAPQGSVQFNNLMRNGDLWSFSNLSDTILHAEYNYWGTRETSAIDSIIFDLSDDPSRGRVNYIPLLDDILSTAPVPPLQKVIKQLAGEKVIVSWEPEPITDLSGFRVHYGTFQDIAFENSINAGFDTIFNISNILISDTIAVTAYDFQADGVLDQPEGFESDFTYAILYPYAGPDTAICYNSEYAISDASAPGFEKFQWSTSGDGSFENNIKLKTVYYPGPEDFSRGYVYLYLYAEDAEAEFTDQAFITFHDAPAAYAGHDTVVSADSTLWLIDAVASGFDHVKWITSGDGTFDSDTIINPVYRPGPADSEAGSVTLTLSSFSACGAASDPVTVLVNPGYLLEGRVHAGSEPAVMSMVSLFVVKNDIVQPLRANIDAIDGNFSIKALLGGTYYLYAIPDKSSSPDFLPTYFYNDIRWEHAHKLILNANTYDVDIDLERTNLNLPAGEGSIFGYCTSVAGSSESCGDITVFLFDRQIKNVLDWVLVRNGSDFRFKDLPFGEYVLAGEKAGTPFFYSDVIEISPSNKTVENIELICTPAGYKFTNPIQPGYDDHDFINLYPNPVIEWVNISGLEEKENYNFRLINSQGIVQKYYSTHVINNNNSLNLKSLPPGIYILEIRKGNDFVLRSKLIKQ